MQSLSFRVGVMKMRKMLHLLGLHGLEDIVGSEIQATMVSVHTIFITGISKAKEDLSFAQVMRMNQRICFVMFFETSTHIIGLFHLIIFRGTPNVLAHKNPETGVLKQTRRMEYQLHQRYLWHDKLLG